MRTVGRLAAALSLALAALVPTVSAADAHSELTSSTPSAKARLDQAPGSVSLTFSDPIDKRFSAVALAVGGSKARTLTTQVSGKDLTVEVPTSLRTAGSWTVTYRVVSADGHPISGTVVFTVTPPPASTPTTTAPTTAPTTTDPPSTTTPPTGAETPSAAPRADTAAEAPRSREPRLLMWLAVAIALMGALAYAVWRSSDRS